MTAIPIPSTTEMYQKVYTVIVDEDDNSITWINVPDNHIQKIAYDSSGRPEYVGFAKPGTADATAGWQIKKTAYDGASWRVTSILFASGDNFFDKKWSLNTTYVYS